MFCDSRCPTDRAGFTARLHDDSQRKVNGRRGVDHPVHVQRLNNLATCILEGISCRFCSGITGEYQHRLIVFRALAQARPLPLRPETHHRRWRVNGEHACSDTTFFERIANRLNMVFESGGLGSMFKELYKGLFFLHGKAHRWTNRTGCNQYRVESCEIGRDVSWCEVDRHNPAPCACTPAAARAAAIRPATAA